MKSFRHRCYVLLRSHASKCRGQRMLLSFFGLAFECIIDTFDENALIRGMMRGKYSFELLLTDLNGEMDKAACTGGMNSLRSAIPFHDLTDKALECDFPFGVYLARSCKNLNRESDAFKRFATWGCRFFIRTL